MATTNSAFLTFTNGGNTFLISAASGTQDATITALSGTRVDKVVVDGTRSGYAKNGGARLVLSGTTAQTVDLTAVTASGGSTAGDLTFASFTQLLLYNSGAASVTVTPGGSNPASLPFTSLTVAAGAKHVLTFGSAVTVDSTHKNITVTPTSGGSFILIVGGA